MKKKFLSMIIAGALCFSIVGCGKGGDNTSSREKKNKTEQTESNNESKKQEENKEKASKDNHFYYKEMGLEYDIPKAWSENPGISPSCVAPGKPGVAYMIGNIPYEFVPKELNDKMMKKMEELKGIDDEEKQEELFNEYASKAKSFFEIVVLDKDMENKDSEIVKEDKEHKGKIFSKYKHVEKVAEKNNLECYILYNDTAEESKCPYNSIVEEKEYTDGEKKEFTEALKHIEELKESVKLSKPTTSEEQMKEKMGDKASVEFETETLSGNKIDNSIFKEHKITMINVWSTTCGPCKAEMPELQELFGELKKEKIDANIIGIVTDAKDDETKELAKIIADKKGVKFDNIVPDEKLNKGALTWIQGTPTTILVDSEGKVIGEPIIGAFGKEKYKNLILDSLESLK